MARISRIAVISTVLLAILSWGPTTESLASSDEESSWTIANDEPSRGELFEAYEADRAAKEGVAFAFPQRFRFADDAAKDRNGTKRDGRVFGIDISRYQGESFPIGVLRSNEITFVYAKATQGVKIKDETFARNWTQLGQAADLPDGQRLYRGAYHFLSADDGNGAAQADRFVAYVKLHGGFRVDDLPPAVDVEWDRACKTCDDRWAGHSPEEIIDKVASFRQRVIETTGRAPIVYSNKSFLSGVGITTGSQIENLLGEGRAWIFDLNARDSKLELPDPQKNLPHQLWQFSWSAFVPGHAGDVDCDVFLGTREQFIQQFVSPK